MEENDTSPQIRSLRGDIARIDRGIVLLLLVRREKVRALFRTKDRAGWPLEDRVQERRVTDRARRWAGRFGLSPEFVERVLLLIIEEAKRDASHHLLDASDSSHPGPSVGEVLRSLGGRTDALAMPVTRER